MAITLTPEQQAMLDGKDGWAVQKAMEIQVQLGEIYGAETMIPITSVHMPGSSTVVSGLAGVKFVEKIRDEGGKFKVLTTLNTGAVDLESWKEAGFNEETYLYQKRLTDAYVDMGAVPAHSCTPYFFGNSPRFEEHVSWGESSAVVFSNSVLGARTNREGGPSALAAALTGLVPDYGYHLKKNRYGQVLVKVSIPLHTIFDYGALGYFVGTIVDSKIPVFTGIPASISTDEIKELGAALASSGSVALFHVVGVTPEAPTLEAAFGPKQPETVLEFGEAEKQSAISRLNKHNNEPLSLVVIGCPHASIQEIAEIAGMLKGKKLHPGIDLWMETSQPIMELTRRSGYNKIIEDAGGMMIIDTCPCLACFKEPVVNKGYKSMATNSAKLAHYVPGMWAVPTYFKTTEQCVQAALTGSLD